MTVVTVLVLIALTLPLAHRTSKQCGVNAPGRLPSLRVAHLSAGSGAVTEGVRIDRAPERPEAVAPADRISSEEELTPRYEALADSLSDADRHLVLDLMRRDDCQPPSVSATVASIALRQWCEQAPADAAAWVAGLPANRFRAAAFREVARIWGESDLESAARWVQGLQQSEEGKEARLAVASAALTQDAPAIAISILSTLGRGRERDELYVNAISQWATIDADQAIAFATQCTDSTICAAVRARISGLGSTMQLTPSARFVAVTR